MSKAQGRAPFGSLAGIISLRLGREVASRLLHTGTATLGRRSGSPTNILPTRREPAVWLPIATYGRYVVFGGKAATYRARAWRVGNTLNRDASERASESRCRFHAWRRLQDACALDD